MEAGRIIELLYKRILKVYEVEITVLNSIEGGGLLKLINYLKNECSIFFKYCKKYKLFFIFIAVFVILLIIKIILELFFYTDFNPFWNNFYNVFLGLSMSALFYYWIEYKRKYIIVEQNKEKVLRMLKRIENMVEKVYSTKRHHSIKWDYYLEGFDYLEYIIEITYKFNWFETSYVESLMWIQIQENYTYFKSKRHNILGMEQEGKKLYIKKGRDFDKKLSQAIKFEEVKKDSMTNEHFKSGLILNDEMSKRIEKVTGSEIPEIGSNKSYYEYCEEEILIIQFLLIITDDIKNIVSKLKV